MQLETLTQTASGTIPVRLPSRVSDHLHEATIDVSVEASTTNHYNGPSGIPFSRDTAAHITITLDIDTTTVEAGVFAELIRDGKLLSLAFITNATTKKETK